MITRIDTDSAAIRKARFLFAERGEIPPWLPDRLVRSWQRCAAMGLPAEKPRETEPVVQQELRLAQERTETLLRMAAPELDALTECVADTLGLVLLTDADGLVLDRRGDLSFLKKAEHVSLQAGVNWKENTKGTNAIGTALVEQRTVEVWGFQHYCHPHEVLSCTASPIVTPSGELAGVLDLSGDARITQGYARGLVQMAVAQIEHRWFTRDLGGRRLLSLHANPTLLGTWQEAILLFEEDVLVAANRAAITLMGLDWASLRQLRFQHLFEGAMPGEVAVPLRMRDGRTIFARSHCERRTQVAVPAREPHREPGPAGVYWDSQSREQLNLAVRALNADIPVLIFGETGTGKEMFARALHASSRRGQKPMVTLNCAAVPEGLIESELFGYEDGAFTGARRRGSPGKLREADGGVLFLDEIGDMPLSMQARLLRVLQNKEITPLGGTRARVVDFVPICATNRDLEADVQAGRFRADLFYRLQHFSVHLTPLRERPEFPALLDTLFAASGAEARRIRLGHDARQALLAHRWPGNIRELANLLRTLIALADDGACIERGHLPPEFRQAPAPPPVLKTPEAGPDKAPEASPPTPLPLDAMTRQAVEQAITSHRGNVSAAARDLGLHRSTVYRILRRPPK